MNIILKVWCLVETSTSMAPSFYCRCLLIGVAWQFEPYMQSHIKFILVIIPYVNCAPVPKKEWSSPKKNLVYKSPSLQNNMCLLWNKIFTIEYVVLEILARHIFCYICSLLKDLFSLLEQFCKRRFTRFF